MKKLLMIALVGFLAACNNDTNDNDGTDAANDTLSTRPRDVNEGVTNSTMIQNDSVIVPDTNNQGANPSAGVDTVGPMRKNATQNRNNNNTRNDNNQ